MKLGKMEATRAHVIQLLTLSLFHNINAVKLIVPTSDDSLWTFPASFVLNTGKIIRDQEVSRGVVPAKDG